MKTEKDIEDLARTVAERHKEDLSNKSFRPTVLWFDVEDRPRLLMWPEVLPDNRGEIAWAMRVLTSTQREAAHLAFVTDNYMAKAEVVDGKPKMVKHDGTEWGPGGMQYAVENQTVDADLVSECFCYHIADNEGSFATARVPYVRTDEGIEFDWDDFDVMMEEGDAKFGGAFPDMMRDAMAQPKMADVMRQQLGPVAEVLGLSQEIADMHMAAVGVKMVMQQTKWQCMIPAYSEDERDVLKDSFENGPFSDGIRVFNEEDVNEIVQLEEMFEAPVVER